MTPTEAAAPTVTLVRSATNTVLVRAAGRAMLVGCAPAAALARYNCAPADVDLVLVTHADRDCVEGAAELAAAGARIVAPEAERSLFEDPAAFWNADAFRVHAYHYHPSPRCPREPAPVAQTLRGGEQIEWNGVRIAAIDAIGPTDGGLSYVLDFGGHRLAAIGDLMGGHGAIRDFHALQGARPLSDGGTLAEYHGFGERAELVLASLDRVMEHSPRALIPAHGDVIDRPAEAIAELRENLDACMRRYWSISAGRWYFAGGRPEWPADKRDMDARRRPLPAWLRSLGDTSRAVVADDGAALVIDCWGGSLDRLAAMQDAGVIGAVDALWVTHYHDDHVGRVNELREREGCQVIAHESMADILRRPDAWRMPCLDPNPITVDRVTHDGETWDWRGFRLTALTCPGQTLLDAALLVERDGVRVLFVGDSLTPGGLDDYCAANRNLLGPGLGYDRCLQVLQQLGPDVLLINEHVGEAFVFTSDEVAAMRHNLAERRTAFGRLLTWDDPNYGLDPQWCRADPYRQVAHAGSAVEWEVVVHNHSGGSRVAAVAVRPPAGWERERPTASNHVPAGGERRLRLIAHVPADQPAGRVVVGFLVQYASQPLGELVEAVVDIE